MQKQHILYNGTVSPKHSFDDLLQAATAGQYNAISVFPETYLKACRQGNTDAQLKQKLKDHKLHVEVIEPLLNWVPNYPFPFSQFMPDKMPSIKKMFAIAHALEAKSISAAWARRKQVDHSILVDAFGSLCHQAQQEGLHVHLEFIPWTQLGNLQQALDFIDQVGASNSGIMFDFLHHYRSGIGNDMLTSIDGTKITGLQLCDIKQKPALIRELEAIRNRLLLGEGAIPIADTLSKLQQAGCVAPTGMEIFSTKLFRNSPEDIGKLSRQSLDKLLNTLVND